MGTEQSMPLRGLIIPDPEFTHARLDATGSSYQESGARPGVSVPVTQPTGLRVVASGSQSEDLDLEVRTSGYPHPTRGPGVVIKADSETSDDNYLTRSAASFMHFASALDDDVGFGTRPSQFAIPDPVQMPWSSTFGLAHDGDFYLFDWSDATWTKTSGICTVSADLRACAVTAIGTRLIFMAQYYDGSNGSQELYYSDDDGATWTALVAGDLLDTDSTPTAFTALEYHAQTRGLVLLLGGYQYASADGGLSFQIVDTTEYGGVIAVGADGSIWGADRTYTDVLEGVRVTSPWEPLRTAERFEIHDPAVTPSDWYSIWVDDDDVPYCAYNEATTASLDEPEVYVKYSRDLNSSDWPNHCRMCLGDYANNGWSNYARCFTSRGFVIAVGMMAAGNDDSEYPLIAHFYGGWTNVEFPRPSGANASGLRSGPDKIWHPPFEFDATLGSGAGPSTGASYQVKTSAGQEFWPEGPGIGSFPGDFYAFSQSTQTDVVLFMDFEPTSGGSTSDTTRGAKIRTTDGTSYAEIEVRIGTSSYQIYDVVNAADEGSAQSFTASTRVQIMVRIRIDSDETEALVSTRYRHPDTPLALWSEGHTDMVCDLAGGSTSGYAVGHITSGTAQTEYYAVWVSNPLGAIPVFSEADWVGHRMTDVPYPVPGLSSSSPDTYIAAVAGPGLKGETFTIPAVYQYPARHLPAVDSPSPDQEWRSTDTTEQIFSWDFTRRRIVGRSPAVVVRDTNIESLVLEGRNGGTGAWTAIGTLDPTTEFKYTITTNGHFIEANATTTGARYIRENELAGAWIKLESGETTVRRHIISNTAGSLNGDADLRVLIELDPDDITGGEPSTGTATIYHRDAVLVVRDATIAEYREWRIRIPSGTTPDGYYRIGALMPGFFQPIGMEPSHGWSHRRIPNVQTTRSSRGVTRKTQRGPNRTDWVWSYQDPEDRTDQASNADDPTWGNNAGPDDALVGYRDVSTLLFGLLDRLEGGALPCCALVGDPTADTTYTDPEAFLYGHLVVDGGIQANHVWGDELVDEIYRVDSVTLEGIPG